MATSLPQTIPHLSAHAHERCVHLFHKIGNVSLCNGNFALRKGCCSALSESCQQRLEGHIQIAPTNVADLHVESIVVRKEKEIRELVLIIEDMRNQSRKVLCLADEIEIVTPLESCHP